MLHLKKTLKTVPFSASLSSSILPHALSTILFTIAIPTPDPSRRVISIDGKTVRGAASDSDSKLHIVSAFCSKNGLSLGQVKSRLEVKRDHGHPGIFRPDRRKRRHRHH